MLSHCVVVFFITTIKIIIIIKTMLQHLYYSIVYVELIAISTTSLILKFY